MNIIIAGCGKIGTTILSDLVAEGHNVIALDNNPNVLSEISNIYDVMSVCGNSADCETLSEAGVQKAELFVAATNSDELNMLSCFLAKRMGAKHTIARIRNPEYNDQSLGFMRQQLDLSMSINPELLAATELFNLLKLPAAAKIETFSHSNFEIIEFRLKEDSILDGISLIEFREKYKTKVLVCAVQRNDEVHIPDGNFVLKSGDRISLTAAPSEINKLMKALGTQQKKARNIMILGGSRTAYYLAKMLTNIGCNVKIIEKDEVLCSELCEALPKAVIINGDGAQQELLLEEGIDSMDAFVALTGIDEENILISIFASTHNVPAVISKVNRNELSSMAQKLGLDCIVSPAHTISNILLQYVRALDNSMGSNVETLYKLMDDSAEALEFNVRNDFKMVERPLKELRFKKNIIIAGIIRDRKIIIPGGDDTINIGDKVIVIAANQRLNDLSDILK